MNSRERVLSHLRGEAVDRLPVMPITMQLACDLIGANYRKYETDYRVLAEGQLEVAERFGFDYVNTMSDPAREAADCGAAVEYFGDSPAALIEDQALLGDKSRLASLAIPDPLGGGRMTNGICAVELLRRKVGSDKIVEGWIEGPCAEGADLRGINTLMLDFYDDQAFVRDLFEFTVEMALRFAKTQVEAGADIIGVGDAAASLVGPAIYEEFVWPFEKKLVDGLHAMGTRVRLHICGNPSFALAGMARLGCDLVDIDFPVSLTEARATMGPQQVLLGNLNPVGSIRNSTPQKIMAALAECHGACGDRFIVGAGCEIPRDTPHENVRALVAYAGCEFPC
jgi:MtaA/CmuA family methyltransferase